MAASVIVGLLNSHRTIVVSELLYDLVYGHLGSTGKCRDSTGCVTRQGVGAYSIRDKRYRAALRENPQAAWPKGSSE